MNRFLPMLAVLAALNAAADDQASAGSRVLPPAAQLPEYTIAHASTPVHIDGGLTEEAWTEAAVIDFILPWTDVQEEGRQGTRARMLWSDDALYIGYECDDPFLHAEVTERDGPVYEEDAVEIFATPNAADISTYFGYEMNIKGTVLDYLAAGGGTERTPTLVFAWQSEGVRLATEYDGTLNHHEDRDTGWVLEVAIPFDNFRHLGGRIPPAPGDEWRLNLNRTAGYEGEYGMWSDSGTAVPDFHRAAFFGRVYFGSPTP